MEEEEELRKISPSEGAHGKNASDYYNMYDLFMGVVEQAKALKADPRAFVDSRGRYDDKIMNAYTRMIGTAIKAISELNRMRNHDRMVSHILDKQARELVQSSTIDLGLELKMLLEAIEKEEDSEDLILRVKKLMYRRLPEIFAKSAHSSLSLTKEEFGILQ